VTRKGEKLFEISAKEASYFRDDRAIRILEPSIVFFDEGKQVGAIQARQGALVIGGNTIESVDLIGDVKFVLTKFEILAGRIQYLHEEKSIVTTGVTTIVSPELTLKGNDIIFNLRKNTLSVGSNVNMTFNQSDADVSAHSATATENTR
jgi:LPS export ABC transporter protein LptC